MRPSIEYIKTCKEFKELFGLDFRKFADTLMFIFGQVTLDVVKLDDYLVKKFHYNEDEMSMSDFITAHFGEKANNLIKELL